MQLSLLITLLLVGGLSANDPTFQPCGTTIENLWLDVVVVVDNSANMTTKNLQLVGANIQRIFGNGIRIGRDYSDPRSTRVGLVTYNKNVAHYVTLDQFKSHDDLVSGTNLMLGSVVGTQESYLANGLAQANRLLTAGRSNNYRANYKQLILVYAATVQGTGDLNPGPIAQALQRAGVHITAVSVGLNVQTSQWLRLLAQEVYPFDGATEDNVVSSAMFVNCHCAPNWYNSMGNNGKLKQGTCVSVSSSMATWQTAKLACQNQAAYLTMDGTPDKHAFLQTIFQYSHQQSRNSSYHIGLNYANNDWYWVQLAGQSMVLLADTMGQNDQIWNSGYPMSMSVNTGVSTVQQGDIGSVGWQNINPLVDMEYYICEKIACDTDHYCST